MSSRFLKSVAINAVVLFNVLVGQVALANLQNNQLIFNNSENQFEEIEISNLPVGNYTLSILDNGAVIGETFAAENIQALVVSDGVALAPRIDLNAEAGDQTNFKMESSGPIKIYLYSKVNQKIKQLTYVVELINSETEEEIYSRTVNVDQTEEAPIIPQNVTIPINQAGDYSVSLTQFHLTNDGDEKNLQAALTRTEPLFSVSLDASGNSTTTVTETFNVEEPGVYNLIIIADPAVVYGWTVANAQGAVILSDAGTSPDIDSGGDDQLITLELGQVELEADVEYQISAVDYQFPSGSDIVDLNIIGASSAGEKVLLDSQGFSATNNAFPVLKNTVSFKPDQTGIFNFTATAEQGSAGAASLKISRVSDAGLVNQLNFVFGDDLVEITNLKQVGALTDDTRYNLTAYDYGLPSSVESIELILVQDQQILTGLNAVSEASSFTSLSGHGEASIFMKALAPANSNGSVVRLSIDTVFSEENAYDVLLQVDSESVSNNIRKGYEFLGQEANYDITIRDFAFPEILDRADLYLLDKTERVSLLSLSGAQGQENSSSLSLDLAAGRYYVAVISELEENSAALLGFSVFAKGQEDTPPSETPEVRGENSPSSGDSGGSSSGAFGGLLVYLLIGVRFLVKRRF